MLSNQVSFTYGEIAPELYGRVDQALYSAGLRTCRNFIVRQFGGVMNRSGSKFIAPAKHMDKKCRLIPFQFNEEQTYILEFGNLYMRVIKDGAQVVETGVNISAATKANPCVVTANSHGYANGDCVYIDGIVGMVELNQRFFKVANKTTNTFELTDYLGNNINSSAYGTYSSGGTVSRVYEVATPYLEADLFELNYTQKNDVLTIANNNYYPRDITRTGHSAWTVNLFANEKGPFKAINDDTSISVGISGGTLIASSGIFTSDMVGDLFYIEENPTYGELPPWEAGTSVASVGLHRYAGTNIYESKTTGTTGSLKPSHVEGTYLDGLSGVKWEYVNSGFGVVSIDGFTSSEIVSYSAIIEPPSSLGLALYASPLWAYGAWSATQGYPAAVTYHKQRLWFGGTTQEPSTLWASGAGARKDFNQGNPILADEAITLTIDGTQVNAIRHLVPLQSLIALTSSTVQVIDGSGGVISAVDLPNTSIDDYNGASKLVPVVMDNRIIYVTDYQNEVRALEYSNEGGGFRSVDLSLRSNHLLRYNTISDWSYQRKPFSCIWSVMSDGTMTGLTLLPDQEVIGWSKHDTDGEYESVASVREGNQTATYVVVKRQINGNYVRYIERFATRYVQDIRDCFFVDSGLTYDGRNSTATTITITGGTTWDTPEVLTLTASAAMFKAADVGDQIVIRYDNDDGVEVAVRLTISAYTSSTVVSAIPSKLVPTAYRSTAFTGWEFARNTFMPLDHLEGKDVIILADGNVVSGKTVSAGKVTLDEPASVVHIGLAYESELETLDIAASESRGSAPIKNKTVNIPRVFLSVHESRSIKVSIDGSSYTTEYRQRTPEIGYDAAIPMETGLFEITTNSTWSKQGRVKIVQSNPLPIAITSITPEIRFGMD